MVTTAEKACNVLHGLKPALIMVVVQATFAAVNVLYKLAANYGMNLRILVAYRFIFAAVFIVPVALIVERNKRPKLTWTVLFQAFLCGLLGGSLAQNMYIQSMVLTSATFIAAMTNLIPAFTFILAITFRLEKLGWGTPAGTAKAVGTLMGITGAMLLTFYKGMEIDIWKTNINLLHQGHHHSGQLAEAHQISSSRLIGAVLAVGSCFCYAMWLIVQAKMAKTYPCPYSSTALMSIMGSIQSVFFAFCVERDFNEWKLGWDVRLLAVAFSGILGSGFMFTLVAWCVSQRGPLFVSIFNPLMLILVAIAGSLLLDERLHLGSVLGAVIIICGLYVVLWGKGIEFKRISQLMPEKTPEESNPTEIVVDSSTLNNTNSGGGLALSKTNSSDGFGGNRPALAPINVQRSLGQEPSGDLSMFFTPRYEPQGEGIMLL